MTEMKLSHAIICVVAFLWLPQQPTGNDILRRVEEQLASVNDYTVDVQADVDMERLRIPKMKATMYFKKPDKVHFEAAGFAMLPREGVALNPAWFRQNFDATVVGRDTLNGLTVQKLQLAAKDRMVRLRQLFLWVNTERWTVEKFETIPYQGRSLTVTFHQARHEGGVFLPDTMNATFGFASEESDSLSAVYQYAPQMNEMQRPPRSGSMTVVYSNYRINTGLSDEMFEKKEKEDGKE